MSMVTNYPGLSVLVQTEENTLHLDEGDIVVCAKMSSDLGETSTGRSNIVGNTSGWKEFSTPKGRYKINCLIIKVK